MESSTMPQPGDLGRQDQFSYSTFYDPAARSAGAGPTAFLVDRAACACQQRTVSSAWERSLPLVLRKAAFVVKRGRSDHVCADAMGMGAPIPEDGVYRLRKWRGTIDYSAVELRCGATSAQIRVVAGTPIERALRTRWWTIAWRIPSRAAGGRDRCLGCAEPVSHLGLLRCRIHLAEVLSFVTRHADVAYL